MQHDKFCWAIDRVYVSANGKIHCWCNEGYNHIIVHPNLGTADFVTDVVNSPQSREMRLTILEGNKPYIPQCHKCCCYQEQGKSKNQRYKDADVGNDISVQASRAYQELKRTTRSRGWPLGSIDRIHEIQIEPSFPCNLKCPGCLHGTHPDPMKTEVGPYILPLEWFKRIIDSIQEHAIRLERMTFVGRGEPTLNKQFPKMLEYARTNIPKLIMSMDTNSTHQFKPEYLLMDWINCSIDGSTKEAYDTYRKGGNFDSAMAFMREGVKLKKELNRSCKIRWKYILFNTTESTELLDLAQEIADDIGIDELDFVITACGAADGSVTPPKIMNTFAIVTNYINNHKIFNNTVVSRS